MIIFNVRSDRTRAVEYLMDIPSGYFGTSHVITLNSLFNTDECGASYHQLLTLRPTVIRNTAKPWHKPWKYMATGIIWRVAIDYKRRSNSIFVIRIKGGHLIFTFALALACYLIIGIGSHTQVRKSLDSIPLRHLCWLCHSAFGGIAYRRSLLAGHWSINIITSPKLD